MAGRPRRRDRKGRYISLRAPEYPLDPRRAGRNPDFDYNPGLAENRDRTLGLVLLALNEALTYPSENYRVIELLEQVEGDLSED